MGSIRRDQLPMAAVYAVGAVVLTVMAIFSGGDIFSFAALGLYLVVGWWSWPGRRGRHVSHAEAQAAASPDDVIVYWRPG